MWELCHISKIGIVYDVFQMMWKKETNTISYN